ncbi:ornithine cyclodeaminase family protein [Alkalihalobacillus macyae]|uniref:ornithine cyclodeaminase family protein n=1 Tax=Guptibacillus hwajinpoensis TaxID=208199 RepID=UPI00273C9203|nr:ornithine cyclodeaminase family protein [Alkalihalobacillus macyae]MDP4553403.1 ornithine cyclodeaminase family protein [Alkalihalobacillus macyae]
MDILSSQEIEQNLSMKEVITSIENYYLTETDQNEITPERMHVEDGDNTFLLMPSFYGDYQATKLAGVAPDNWKLGKDTIHGMMILNDRKTLAPLLYCDFKKITALRTGALGGLGMKYLSQPDASSLGIIGLGTQGWSHLQAAMAVRPIEKVYVFNRSKEKIASFIENAKEAYPQLAVEEVTIEELVKRSDIVVTTTTSTKPVLPDLEASEWNGKLVVAVGAFKPAMQELPDSFLRSADSVYVDTRRGFHEAGDLIRASELGRQESDSLALEEITQQNHRPDNLNEKGLLFKTVGIAIFDLIVTKTLYEKMNG